MSATTDPCPDAGSRPQTDPDPRPQPPAEPDLADCCGSGCNPCVFDLHDVAMERYRHALQAWRERHPEASRDGD